MPHLANAKTHREWSGDGTAKKLEEERARKVYAKQAEAAKKGFQEAMAEPAKTETVSVSPAELVATQITIEQPDNGSTVRKFSKQQLDDFERKIESIGGFDATAEWFATTPEATIGRSTSEALNYARCTIRDLRDPKRRHKKKGKNLLALIIRDGGKTQTERSDRVVAQTVEVQAPSVAPESGVFEAQPNVEHQPRPPSSEDTGIVKTVTVDGWSIDFRLPMLSRDGAERARITLTELANRLGYSDKQRLKELANRHASELAEFGVTLTVSVTQKVGVATRTWSEPTYNPDQAAYLALSSETEAGRACRVRILKAYKALLGLFEEAAASSRAIEPLDGMMRQLLANQTQMMGQILQSQNNLTALVAAQIANPRRERRQRDTLGQQTIPQAEPVSPRSEIVRLAEQDQTTNRKVLSAMIKRLAGVHKGMPTVEYGARMSVAYHQIEDELPRFGHNMSADMKSEYLAGRRANSLEYFENKGIVRLVMKIVEELYEAKIAAKRDEKDSK